MSKILFRVRKPGLLTTIQDAGRYGYQQYGVSAAGAMDSFSMHIANILVGNQKDEAVLEITLNGPELEVMEQTTIAICGANLSPKLNGENIPLWRSFFVNQGDHISFGKPLEGARAYLSISGGFDVPRLMGSKSTDLKAAIGGMNGQALHKGDVLYGTGVKGVPGRSLHPDEIPRFSKYITSRVVLGPHLDAFSDSAIDGFLSSVYEVSTQADRMGYRLEGPRVEHFTNADIISEAIPLGGIQIPANGQPIILMADRQTTGGYTRIATIISTDLSQVAQAVPGCKIRFRAVTVQEAQNLYNKRIKLLKKMESASN